MLHILAEEAYEEAKSIERHNMHFKWHFHLKDWLFNELSGNTTLISTTRLFGALYKPIATVIETDQI